MGPNGGFRRQLLAAELAIFGKNSVGLSLLPEVDSAGAGSGDNGGGGGSSSSGGGGGGASLSKWKKKQIKKEKGGGCLLC